MFLFREPHLENVVNEQHTGCAVRSLLELIILAPWLLHMITSGFTHFFLIACNEAPMVQWFPVARAIFILSL